MTVRTASSAIVNEAAILPARSRGVDDLTLGVRPPRQAGDLINGVGVPCSCCGGGELISEHGFSVRGQAPPKGAHDFRQSSAAAKNGSCNDSVFRGVSGLPRHLIFPGSAGTPARL